MPSPKPRPPAKQPLAPLELNRPDDEPAAAAELDLSIETSSFLSSSSNSRTPAETIERLRARIVVLRERNRALEAENQQLRREQLALLQEQKRFLEELDEDDAGKHTGSAEGGGGRPRKKDVDEEDGDGERDKQGTRAVKKRKS